MSVGKGTPPWERLNYIAVPALVILFASLSVWLLATSPAPQNPSAIDGVEKEFSLVLTLFHSAVAFAAVELLIAVYSDPTPLVVHYKIVGRDDIPEVEHKFRSIGRWTTFTLWCNTIACLYFLVAALSDVLLFFESTPKALLRAKAALWEITFPMAFLVNLVVSFVLLPACKKLKKLDKLEILLRFRPQCLHNGYVLVAALEGAIVAPAMKYENLPAIVLFGVTYIVFAVCLWLRCSVFHYFFLDPRFKFAIPAMVSLLLLLACLHCLGRWALAAAAESTGAGVTLVIAALATCTFRDKALDGYKPTVQSAAGG
mmetsp:Transcript_85295/g.178245  ORF Transcript_85295/g.178245 Transcript_85295/m.178245 type:complete len:314 (-) Transcript_85295:240-1181(-)|eukprot:CAMPEP_0206443800 /NCGR_PEP_ID=MMETSP0324_2-20121206/14565_1 /ASSEMBLY_ACC=CAM_ASM_000836 /TAXON_ID=2866 /ORGANISM="Crypthecodinium cohnii, Strain Seligo" /LENGTH=313 /DNA_ID=CAMNT_0053911767 /DNA_START=131 /DNA_END=1072 /DNA_ORIENTATION=-